MARAIYTVPQLVEAIAEYLGAYNCLGCYELHHLWDWTGFLTPHVHEKFTGFGTGKYGSGMHEFVFRKDAQGEVRMWFRKSSKASNWLPDGPGMLVFKSTPIGQPAIKKAHPDEAWRRSTVEATVRSWFRWMPVQPDELQRIKQEWGERFAHLPPPSGDLSGLDEKFQLKWMDLPTISARAHGVEGSHARSRISGTLENPPVNPVTGLGRTAADVTAELEAFKKAMRAISADAIFQADFLFLQGVGKGTSA